LGALFLWLCLFVSQASVADRSTVVVAKVIDGDTVILNDKRHIRLIGINTPETAKKGRPGQPLANLAKQRLQALINAGNIVLTAGKQKRDHHGRMLAYLETDNAGKIDIQAQLLSEGLAWLVAIPPNISRLKVYSQSQAQAKKHQRGIWASSYFQPREASNLGKLDRGFLQVRGKIKNIGRSRKFIYLNFSQRFSVRISHPHWNKYFPKSPEIFNNKTVIVSGWISKQRNDKLGMKIGHPAMIEVMP
jgi:endonuclease YncB( thermonuclease family)